MGTVSIPVMSHVGEIGGSKDVVLSLLELAPPEKIRFTGRPSSNGSPYQKIDLKVVNTSVQALASLGFAEFVSTKVDSKFFCSYMDLAVSKKVKNQDADSFITEAVFGIGFRLAIIAFNMNAEVKANFSAMAAAGKIKGGMTSYQMVAIGGGLDVITKARPLITNLSGDFTVETLETIGFVEAQLAELAISNADLIPQLMGVTLDLDKMAKFYANSKDPVAYKSLIVSQHFALWRAFHKNSLEEALSVLKSNPDFSEIRQDIVQDYYTRILGIAEAKKRPEEKKLRDRIDLMIYAGT